MSMFTEKDGKTSYSRVSGIIIVLTWLCTAFIQTMNKQPPVDIPLGWASIVAGLYGLNKLSDAFGTKK